MKTAKTEIMQFLADQFETRKNENGETFVRLCDSAPQWCRDVVMECHDGMLPDNWRYSWIARASASLAGIDPEKWEEQIYEIADDLTDVYHNALLSWLSSNSNRVEYVNEALPLCNDLFSAIQYGQHQEIAETLQLLVREVESKAERD